MRLVSTFSLQGAWRGQPQILEIFVIPGDEGRGVRLVVNEIPYQGPLAAGRLCIGPAQVLRSASPGRIPSCWPTSWPSAASPTWTSRRTRRLPLRWLPRFVGPTWPQAVRIEMAPLDPDASRLQPISMVAPIHVFRHPEIPMAISSRRGGNRRCSPPSQRRAPGGAALRARRGSALLMVLWISAALAAIAFSLANTVRGETDRTSTELDEVRGYYLATGAVDRAAVELLWSVTIHRREGRKIKQGSAWVDYTFPTGAAHVELIPETAKLDVNNIPPEQLMRLLTALGVDPGPAAEITRGIIARRAGAPAAGIPYFLSPGSVFSAAAERLFKR